MAMRCIASFVGWSSTGKTTLVSRLIEELTRRGYRVAAVKKTNHHVADDREGSDTELFRRAGSPEIALVGSDAARIYRYDPVEASELLELFPRVDRLLAEGFYFPGHPCIEVLGSRSADEGPKRKPEEISAYVLSSFGPGSPMPESPAPGSPIPESPAPGRPEPQQLDAPRFARESGKPIFESADIAHILTFLEELWNEK
jgi:molybdopterin-guanine dinucleotide biosynthesis protein B